MATRSRRKPPTRRRKTSSRATPSRPALPVVPAGQRVWLLELPWSGLEGGKPPGLTYYKSLRAHAYVGTRLPDKLAPYASKPYSYARWREDELNGFRALPVSECVARGPALRP